MHLSHATFRVASARRATSALIAGGLVLCPTTSAYGITFDGIVTRMSEQPLLTFGVGCAVGAVVGGLVTFLVGQRRRRALHHELDRLYELFQERMYPDILSEIEVESILDLSPEPNSKPSVAPDGPQGKAASTQKTKPVQQAQLALPAQSSAVQKPPVQASTPAASAETAHEVEDKSSGHSVHETLLSRLSDKVFDDVPVIDRGEERMARAKEIEDRFATRCMDCLTRAKVIDKRVPEFDDAIFPETTEPEQDDKDDFERGLDAMDDMEQTMPMSLQADEPVADQEPSEEAPAAFDAAAHVEELFNDEVELLHSSKARRFSRSQLTVIAGTGDLSKARKRAYVPRHLARVSKEA